MNEIKNVVICGAGMMGKGLAQIFSGCEGIHVTVQNRRDRQVHESVRENLEQLRDKGVITDEEIEARLSRITFTLDKFGEEMKNADLVIECVAEEMATKQDLFAELEDVVRPDCIFATNTSVMSVTEIASKCKKRDRVVGAHFWNPAFLIPLVEVVKTEETSDEAIQMTMDVLTKVGKKPVLCKKDVPGFIANRMQHALWREAISIVENGIADAKTVDDAVKYSFGLRLPQLAPMENSDMVGLQLTYNIHEYVLKHLEDSHEPSPLLKEYMAQGKMGFASGEGFQKWSEEDISNSKKGLNEYLIKMIYGV